MIELLMDDEVVMTYLKVLSRRSPGGTQRNHEKPQDSLCLTWDSTQARHEYKSEC